MLRYLAFHRTGAVLVETSLLICCFLGGRYIVLHQSPLHVKNDSLLLAKALLIAVVFQIFLHLRDVYDLQKTHSKSEYIIRLGQALILGSAILWILFYMIPQLLVGRGVYAVSLGLIIFFLVLWHSLLRVYWRHRAPTTKMLVLGTGPLARELVAEISRHPELGMRVQGFVDDDPAMVGVSLVNPKVLGLYDQLQDLVRNNQVDRIVVELQDRRGKLPLKDLLYFKTRGIVIEEATTVYERVTGKIPIDNLKPSWLIFNSGFHVSPKLILRKRILSILVSAFLLILFAPVLLILMALIKLDTPGPVFHRQKRVGQD
jgi:FlaA1/EpsC-like NDP-sugar epimerase